MEWRSEEQVGVGHGISEVEFPRERLFLREGEKEEKGKPTFSNSEFFCISRTKIWIRVFREWFDIYEKRS
jgi:hypothetical protein